MQHHDPATLRGNMPSTSKDDDAPKSPSKMPSNSSFLHLAGLALAVQEIDDTRSLSFEVSSYLVDEFADQTDDEESSETEEEPSPPPRPRPPPPPPPGDDDDGASDGNWPTMVGDGLSLGERLSRSERLSERRSERLSERFSEGLGSPLGSPLPPLLPPTPNFEALRQSLAEDDELLLPATFVPARRPRRPSQEAGEDAIPPLDDVLAQRDAAATVLTGGRAGLPELPVHLARDMLDAALPIAPSLAHFAAAAKLDLSACLSAAAIDVAHKGLAKEHADVLAWLMRRSLRASLVWGAAPSPSAPLLELDASGNALGARGASSVGKALPHAPSLRSLKLAGCLLCSAGGADTSGLVDLARAISCHPSLCELSLASNAMGASASPNIGIRTLVAALGSAACSVATVDVSDNKLGCAGAELLARLVSSQPKLRCLSAARNQLTGEWGREGKGVRALAAAVAESASLASLDLSSNCIGSKDGGSMDMWSGLRPTCPVVYLVECLRLNSSLSCLNLSDNRLLGGQGERLRDAWLARGAPADGLLL